MSDELFPRLALWEDPLERDGPAQMACDETIHDIAGLPVMRVFRWCRPWVSAGYFVPLDEAEIVRSDLPVCRRWTGGGIVVHEGDFTFSLSVPKNEAFASLRPTESYRRIHLALADALRRSGRTADLAEGAGDTPRECFEGAVQHDLVADGRKIAGGAQRRTRRGLLYQGSVQTEQPLESGFGALLAQSLAFSVHDWKPPGDFEHNVERLTAGKYASSGFLCGLRALQAPQRREKSAAFLGEQS